MTTKPLAGRIALVAGATRGAGRAFAVELGAHGATVYATGRSTTEQRSEMDRPETIDETARLVTEAGGTGIPVVCDHLDPHRVQDLVRRIDTEQGRLDILVNNIWGGDPFTDWDSPLWEQDVNAGLRLLHRAIDTHIITAHAAIPLLIRRPGGLVIEVTDGNTETNTDYRGTFFYDLAKTTPQRMALGLAAELKKHDATALALSPGWIRSEAMLEHFGVTEGNWRDAAATEPHFVISETPHFVARVAAALAADPHVSRWAGKSLGSWDLAAEYGVVDLDGSRPDWGRYHREVVVPGKPADATGYR